MKKVAVFGNAGGGKSTLARRLSELTRLPLYPLDLIEFQVGGGKVPREQYLEAHAEILARDEWIIDGYGGTESAWERFAATLEDDFNTPDALAVLHEWRDHELLRRALGIFGLSSLGNAAEAPTALTELARRRDEARAARDYAEADRLRAEIEAAGWEVRDEAGGHRLVRRP